jgi:aryl-alcohol dehydrogenase-like predicted oxidoreductase
MVKRPLGNTGMEVSEIAFGCVEIGMPYGIGVHSTADMLTEKEAIYLLQSAADSGINFFDTARQYGSSELIIGKAFKDRRKEIVLATKCKHLKDDCGQLPSSSELKKILGSTLQESLDALQTDYIDLYMLHDSDREVLESEEVLEFFHRLRQSGIIKAAGVSTYTPEETEKVIADHNWDVIQVPFNLMDQRQQNLFSQATENGIGIVVRSVLLKGLLSAKGKALHPALKDVENHISLYDELLNQSSVDLPSFATKFALSFKEVSSILIGLDRLQYLYKSLEAADGKYFEGELLQRARELAYPDPGFLNLHSWNLKGWLK